MRKPGGQKARGFYLAMCDKPNCGPHIIAFDRNEVPICDVAIPLDGVRSLIQALQRMSYIKAVEQDDEGD